MGLSPQPGPSDIFMQTVSELNWIIGHTTSVHWAIHCQNAWLYGRHVFDQSCWALWSMKVKRRKKMGLLFVFVFSIL